VRRQGGYALSTEFATIKLVDGPHKKDVGHLHQQHREGEKHKQPVGDGRIWKAAVFIYARGANARLQ